MAGEADDPSRWPRGRPGSTSSGIVVLVNGVVVADGVDELGDVPRGASTSRPGAGGSPAGGPGARHGPRRAALAALQGGGREQPHERSSNRRRAGKRPPRPWRRHGDERTFVSRTICIPALNGSRATGAGDERVDVLAGATGRSTCTSREASAGPNFQATPGTPRTGAGRSVQRRRPPGCVARR